jgi:hypothetical protein
MLISSIAFVFFVFPRVWPQAVLFVSFRIEVLVPLRRLLFGVHRLALSIRWVLKGIRVGASFSLLFSRGNEAADIPKDEVVGDEEEENAIQAQGVPARKFTTNNHDINATTCMYCVCLNWSLVP